MRLRPFTLALLVFCAAPTAGQAPQSDASRIVDISFPPGSYAASFRTTMRDLMDKQAGSEDARKLDPNSGERMRITYKVIDEEAERFGQAQEPKVREAMIAAVGANFSAEQQREIRVFLETPSGRAYASKMPALSAVLETPEQQAHMMVAMEELTAKIEAATAHLPQR